MRKWSTYSNCKYTILVASCYSTIRQCSEYLIKVQVFVLFTVDFATAKKAQMVANLQYTFSVHCRNSNGLLQSYFLVVTVKSVWLLSKECCQIGFLESSLRSFFFSYISIFFRRLFGYIPAIFTITMQPTNSACVGSKKHQTAPEMLIYRPSAWDPNLTKWRSFSTTFWFKL